MAIPTEDSSHTRSLLRAPSLRSAFAYSNRPATERSTGSTRLSFQKKARKLSRVFTDMTLLDSLVGRKSIDDTRGGQSRETSTTLQRARTNKVPKIQLSEPLAEVPSQPTSPTIVNSTTTTSFVIAIPDTQTTDDANPQRPSRSTTPSTSHPQPPLSPEQIPLPPSRPGSSGGSYKVLTKKRRKSLDVMQVDEFRVKASRSIHPRLKRISSSSDLSRPVSPKPTTSPRSSSLDIRETSASPEIPYNHYIEVKRARKMTQLFGQELPPELVRVLTDRRNVEPQVRRRIDSNASSVFEFASTTTEDSPDTPGEENVMLPSPPKFTDFQERRRRVTKLTQFFGVNHAELSSIMFTKPGGFRSTSIDEQASSMSIPEPAEVGVKMVSRRRWGLGEDMREVEISDAITKLRGLKAN